MNYVLTDLLFNLNPVELNYYPFLFSLDKCNEVVMLLMNFLQKNVFQVKQKISMLKYLMCQETLMKT